MPNLAQLQERMTGVNLEDAAAAGRELSNYFIVYNDEYNTLITKRQEAEFAIIDASRDPAGVDHAVVLHLQSLVLGTESRMKVQDARMLAFQASALAINPPDAAQVQLVKDLTAQLAVMIARDETVESIMVGLGQVAGVINQIQGG
ncbi:hypothetical protein [Aquabacterium sp. CECT 9606]|uniref:hypothetical protein n=1 Tax=Aquabacterium sp. CECT 9606 TaxID=2845822 RepID=UPI001E59318A|nr:hypothetical protein [Aquabacterium sp. CECT 9606]CAH0353175.1 hypothetical protein AQB9606_03099 [Aquabacterium sp. CECT 9606]